MIATVVFLVVAMAMVGAAVAVVTSHNLVHGVFWLAGLLVATAILYVTLDASFLAAIQVVLYTGGVITLMLFAVMLTQRDPDTHVPNPSGGHGRAAVLSAGLGGVLLAAIWTTPELASFQRLAPPTATDLGRVFLGPQVVAFEALSVLLLAAMIGAVVLARKKDP